MKERIIYFSGLMIISSFIFSDSTNIEKDKAADIKKDSKVICIHQQNKQCLKELDIKWVEIEKLIKQKINNKK